MFMTNKKNRVITVALANHRPETVQPAAELMSKHDAIFLEESSSRELEQMLTGDISVNDYLQNIDTEYPEFRRQMALQLRKLHAAGKAIMASEPFLEHLLAIHEFFIEGGTPADLRPDTDRFRVYEAEHKATEALLDFYRAAIEASFDETVSAVKRFARQDAGRFVLRDEMRAEALAKLAPEYECSYVEAGQMHYYLWHRLNLLVGYKIAVKPNFLMAPVVRNFDSERHLYGPGDILTLLYIFHPSFQGPLEDLLAARSLIYNKLIEKNEMAVSIDTFPHTRNELQTSATVKKLSMADCRRLFSILRRTDTQHSVKLVDSYLSHKGIR